MIRSVVFFGCFTWTALTACAGDTTHVAHDKPSQANADVPITLPTGFTSITVTSNLGQARHLVVAANGDLFVKLNRLKGGKGIYRLHDSNGDGRADVITGFGNYGGTGITIKNGYLYASSNSEVFRYKIDEKTGTVDTASKQRIVTGLIDKGEHNSKSIVLDNNGNIYVNIGAPSNDCQPEGKDREKGVPGQDPCPLLPIAGGIWQFKADKENQSYADAVHYATGLRNVVGLDWNTEVNALYVMQHGRDQLFQNYPNLFDQKAGAENPAEELFRINKGADCGWPYCYYDNDKKEKLLNPEYGGDRSKTGPCESKVHSLVQFPGHLAPNGLLFYTGSQFPEKYRNGAFIAFHGSWNRAPEPQAGYFVVFVPFKNGLPSGKWEVFADGFVGGSLAAGDRAKYRPCGLAQGPDGSLYVSDDNNGTIWKISYTVK
ncbi:MAG TPA: PQQ-dependent sugar dehydrogenase [Chitinophagaceae bacterium]